MSPYIKECKKIIEDWNLTHQLGANGTAIEVDWEEVQKFVKKCHEKLHQKCAPRIFTFHKVNTRIDKFQRFKDTRISPKVN